MAIKIKINKKHQELSDACCEGRRLQKLSATRLLD